MKTNWIAAGALVLAGLTVGVSVSQAKEEVDRIREKAEELASRFESERYSFLGEGKESNLDRVYRDYDYLLKSSKNDAVREAMAGASGPEADRLQRLDAFLLHGRIFSPVAASFDNSYSYRREAAMSVGDREVNLQSYELSLANEDDRSKRRIMYLASRDLRENYNVFEINLKIDLDRHSNEVAGKDYSAFLADIWHFDPAELEAICSQVLDATKEEYAALLPRCIAETLDGMPVDDFREYDRPILLRAKNVDPTFKGGKEIDVADKWLKDMGMSVSSARKLRLKVESKPGMWPDAAVFPIGNSSDTRVSMVPMGGLRDYWELFGALGRASFYYNIDDGRPFEFKRLGSPLTPMVYGALFQSVLTDDAWCGKYVAVKDADAVARAVRLRQLFALRTDAARYIFQRRMAAGENASPTDYVNWMQETLLYPHTSSEESDYMLSEDLHRSGLRVWAAVLAAQLEEKLVGQFGEDWWSKGEAGKWLRAQWARGFEVQPTDLGAALEVGPADPAFIAAH